MTALDDIKADLADLLTTSKAGLDTIQLELNDLKNQIASGSGVTTADLADLDGAIKAARAEIVDKEAQTK